MKVGKHDIHLNITYHYICLMLNVNTKHRHTISGSSQPTEKWLPDTNS
jgi:hypothetical protein